MREIWFWQRIVSPHMAALAVALAGQGCNVVYVAEREMSEPRANMGWRMPALPGVGLHLASTPAAMAQLAQKAPAGAVHLCQGLRGNGCVGVAQRVLRRRGARLWVVMEAVADAGRTGILKRALYRMLFRYWSSRLAGVLAIGASASAWVVARGVPAGSVFPFAYFLSPPGDPEGEANPSASGVSDGGIRFLFVGRLDALKRVDLLLDALADLRSAGARTFRLQVVGQGPRQEALQAHAAKVLPGCVDWVGGLPMAQARLRMRDADCLILPSDYDGWGAVVSEALMAGTPVVCSDACGAVTAVSASGAGGVFPAGDRAALANRLAQVLDAGRQPDVAREALARWALALAADAGAAYLIAVLEHAEGRGDRPAPPWQVKAEADA
ncbi:MAG: glycosyltransferase family 4 protein [Thermomonas haemolytica]